MAVTSILEFQRVSTKFEIVLAISVSCFKVIFHLENSFFIKNLVFDEEYVFVILVKILLLKNTCLLNCTTWYHGCFLYNYWLHWLISIKDRHLLIFGCTCSKLPKQPLSLKDIAWVLSPKFQISKLHRLWSRLLLVFLKLRLGKRSRVLAWLLLRINWNFKIQGVCICVVVAYCFFRFLLRLWKKINNWDFFDLFWQSYHLRWLWVERNGALVVESWRHPSYLSFDHFQFLRA